MKNLSYHNISNCYNLMIFPINKISLENDKKMNQMLYLLHYINTYRWSSSNLNPMEQKMGWWSERVPTWSSNLITWETNSKDKLSPNHHLAYLGQSLYDYFLLPLAHVHWFHLLLNTINIVPEDTSINWIFVN